MFNKFIPAKRLNLPGYPFAELERKAAQIRASGRELYDLSIGDPDLAPPEFVVQAVRDALNEPQAHKYPSSRGDRDVRKSVARWFHGRFGVELDPDSQICILIGAKEGLGQLARAVVNPGDVVTVPDPAYPVYGRAGCQLVKGKLQRLLLDPENDFLPDLNQVAGSRLLYLNYPNNPTGAIATDRFLQDIANLAGSDPSMTVAYDMAYSEVTFNKPARSLLEFTSSVVEFHSLSKMANATGYRIGFAVGDPDRIAALIRIKEEIDSGVPLPFQRALAITLDSYDGKTPHQEIVNSKEIYRKRRERLITALGKLSPEVFHSEATFYVWFKVGDDELDFIAKAIESGILLTPGSGFGESGRGWVRASVTASDEVIDHAVEALKTL